MEAVKVGFSDTDAFTAQNIRIENGAYVFDVKTSQGKIENITFHLPGRHNMSNALMALSMAKTYGVSDENIKKALSSFKGIQRRFSYQIKSNSLVYIDDYAHHPTEINAVYNAIHEMYPDKKNLIVFQPHLYSRTKDFIDEFAQSLSQFDEVLLLDIYPARELPIPGITSEYLLSKISSKKKSLVTKESLNQSVLNADAQIIITAGAGNIGEMVMPLKTYLQNKQSND